MTIDVGSTIAGYRIEALVGRGGMGEVYRATQLGLKRPVALKLVAAGLSSDEGFRQRFQQEAELAAGLDHPNVLPVYETGEAEGRLYLSMRIVDGRDLGQVIAQDGPLQPERAVAIVEQVASALDAAHARRLVHRDVKPVNVLIELRDGREHAYLADFGIAKSTAATGVTGTGQVIGTVDYIAPEQITTGTVDARGDVYALGCVLFECLTGQPPFTRETDLATLWAQVHDAPPSLRSARPDAPATLAAVVARALQKDPADRYASAGELGAAAVAAVNGDDAPPVGRRRPSSRPGRRRWLVAAVALALAAAAAAGLAIAASDGEERDADGTAATTTPAPATESAAAATMATTPASEEAAPTSSAGAAARTDTADLSAASPPSSVPIKLTGPPIDIAISDDTVWALTANGDLFAIDSASRQVVGAPLRVVASTGFAAGVAPDPARDVVWLLRANRDGAGSAVPLDSRSKEPLGDPIPTGHGPVNGVVAGDVLWVFHRGDVENERSRSTVVRVDVIGRRLIGDPIDVGDATMGTARLAVGDESVWVANYSDKQIIRIDRNSGDVVGKPIPVEGFPGAISVADGDEAWFAYDGYESVGRVDPRRHEVVGIPLRVGGPPPSTAVDGNDVWVAVQGGAVGVQDVLTLIDRVTHQVVALVPSPPAPYGLAAKDGVVWVGSQDETVVALDAAGVAREPARPGSPDAPGTLPFSGRLPPGTYRSGEFREPFTFTVPTGWALGGIDGDAVFISLDEPVPAGVGIALPGKVFEGPNGDQLAPAPDDLMAWLRAHPSLQVSEATDVTVGGWPGQQVDITLKKPPPQPAEDCPTCLNLLAFGDRTSVYIEEGAPIRITILDGGVRDVVVMASTTPTSAVTFEEFMPLADEVIATIRWTNAREA
jgi:hypothetical protein